MRGPDSGHHREGFPGAGIQVRLEPPAVVAVVMDFVGATLPQLDQLLDSLRFKSGGPGLPGSLFQWSRGTGDGVRVTEVWRSSRHFELFLRDVIAPRLSEAGMPKPEDHDVRSPQLSHPRTHRRSREPS